MHLARVGGALAPADPVLDPPLVMTQDDHPLPRLVLLTQGLKAE